MRPSMTLGFTELIVDTCARYGCLRNQAAYILATAYWETGRTMKPVREAFYVSKTFEGAEAWRKRNLRYYPWYGRGFVQLTWKANYEKASAKLGVDFIAHPAAVMEPKHSAAILVAGSMEGWFTGKKIPDYITLTKSNFIGARRVINGTDKATEIADIASDYDQWLKGLGYGETSYAPPPPANDPPMDSDRHDPVPDPVVELPDTVGEPEKETLVHRILKFVGSVLLAIIWRR